MEIGLIYSRKDPRQTRARNFLRKYIRERGILARIIETEKAVESPTVIIDGHALKERRTQVRSPKQKMYPGVDDIARAIDKHTWSL